MLIELINLVVIIIVKNVSLIWIVFIDNVGIKGYEILCDGVVFGES